MRWYGKRVGVSTWSTRVSRDEERMFLDVAKEIVDEVEETKGWIRRRDPEKHAGGKPTEYPFRQMTEIWD